MNPTTDLTPARQLLARGFKLCRLIPNTKRPAGTGWHKHPVTKIRDDATGYGVLLAANDLCSIDPDDAALARKAFKVAGFDYDDLMHAGVRTLSTRVGSGGRSAFKAQAGLAWVKFRVKIAGKVRTVFELRAASPNLQDVLPGCTYVDQHGITCTQTYGNNRTFEKPPKLPAKFAAWWRRMSTDEKFRREQERIMGKAIGAQEVPDLSSYAGHKVQSGISLRFASPKRGDFNLTHRIEPILERHGYIQEGSRYRAPDATGSAGVRLIPGKQDLWQSDHGSDPLNGTFDAWTAFVVLDHNGDVAAAERALKRNGKTHVVEPPQEVDPERPVENKLPDEFDVDDLDTMAIPPTQWVVDGLIRPGLTLLAAPPKQGKSYLVLQMCLCVTGGVPFLGMQTTPVRTVYYDLEEWHELLKERVTPIRAGHKLAGVKLPLFRVKLKSGVGEEAIEDMRREIERGAKLLVVDLLARVRDEMNEDSKKNVYARDYNFLSMLADFALQQPGVAIVVVHHANKGQHDEWQNKISGSAGMTGASHTNIYMARPDLRGMDDADKQEALRYRVLHAVGKGVKDQEVALEMMPDGGGWQVSPYKPWEVGTTLKQRNVLLVLAEDKARWWSAKEVAARLGLTAKNVALMLFRMMKEGTVESDGRGGDGYRIRSGVARA